MATNSAPLKINTFYHQDTSTWSYILEDTQQKLACIIDPVLDFDLSSGQYSYASAHQLIDYITKSKLTLTWICETHAHADHLTAAAYIKEKLGGKTVIGSGIQAVQQHFSQLFNLDIQTNGSQFDQLVSQGDTLTFGDFSIEVIASPGHTPDGVCYAIDNNLFIGDTFFHPKSGTARCDFPGGDAKLLFQSLNRILDYSQDATLWLCHDYPGNDRTEIASISVAEMKNNIHLVAAENQMASYVQLRQSRDAQLSVPKLLYPALQVNICAGELPAHESNGTNYLKIPLREKK